MPVICHYPNHWPSKFTPTTRLSSPTHVAHADPLPLNARFRLLHLNRITQPRVENERTLLKNPLTAGIVLQIRARQTVDVHVLHKKRIQQRPQHRRHYPTPLTLRREPNCTQPSAAFTLAPQRLQQKSKEKNSQPTSHSIPASPHHSPPQNGHLPQKSFLPPIHLPNRRKRHPSPHSRPLTALPLPNLNRLWLCARGRGRGE